MIYSGRGKKIAVEDLIASLGENQAKAGNLKAVQKLSKKAQPLEAPLPGPIQARVERKAAYDESKKDIKKWMPLVKSQREAPTLQLASGRTGVHKTTSVSAVVAKHTPENKMELEVAAMLQAAGAQTAAAVAESEDALAMRMLNAEEAKARREELAKQRALLFYHEIKAKRLKKIKSKDYRRRLKKAEKKKQDGAGEDGMLMLGDEELQQQREDAEYERAKERLTLKHKNTSRFIRRAIKRGSKHAPDEATREAIAEQLRLGEEIRRKVNAFKVEGGSDSSDGDSDDSSDDERRDARLSRKLQSAARDVLEGEDPTEDKGLMSLPFMKRSMEKQKQKAIQQAQNVLNGGDNNGISDLQGGGRLKFGGGQSVRGQESSHDMSLHDISEEDDDVDEDAEAKLQRLTSSGKVVQAGSLPDDASGTAASKTFIPAKKFQGMKKGYMFTKGSRGVGYYAENESHKINKVGPALAVTDGAELKKLPNTKSEAKSVSKPNGKSKNGPRRNAPAQLSQEELIKKAFAGDDVVDEFKKSKREEVESELPQEEVPGELPGWGTWSNPTKKEPAWVREAKAKAAAKKNAAARSRKDSAMEFVVISEKWDSKNASKYKTQSVPYPFNSKDTYERSMRQPLGKDFNTVDSFRNLTRPAIVKDSGVIIEPLQFSKAAGVHNASAKLSNRPSIIKVSGGMTQKSSIK
jgi:U3 small nucleolar RNA-associated protein 14